MRPEKRIVFCLPLMETVILRYTEKRLSKSLMLYGLFKFPARHKSRCFCLSASHSLCAAGIAAVLASALPHPVKAGIIGGNYGKSFKNIARRNYKSPYTADIPVFGSEGKAPIIRASLGSYARNFPAGIYRQSYSVNTGCFGNRMMSLLTSIQRRYRHPLIITSGYRSPSHNIQAGGVRDSLHIACAAADIKVLGVNKYQLANYVRSLPNRGGIGLYCHDAVHVDIGSPREWNWCSAGHPRRA